MGRKPHGVPVTLYEKVNSGQCDPFGVPIYTRSPVTVENVIIGQPTTQEVVDTLNLTGKKIVYLLGIPKGDEHVWTDRKVSFFGEDFHTIAGTGSGHRRPDSAQLEQKGNGGTL